MGAWLDALHRLEKLFFEPTQHLLIPSGNYSARLRVGGKLIRRRLKTDVLSVAKLRRDG